MEPLSGKTLGRYQLKAVLGGGGMGEVYRAYDPNLQRDVAIKVMHPHLQYRPGFKERFLQEGVVAARLKHPGIVQVFDSGEANMLYIVMAFIPGSNLEEMLDDLRAQGNWVVLNEAIELVAQVSQALDYAHRRGILHRDIKPSNIMLEPEPCGGLPYHPVLTDLGLAKLLEGGVETQTGTSMGTPAYMSPEQAQGLAVDARSDVYSLGALLYHLCVGKPPFPAKTITEAIQYHVHQTPPPPRQSNPHISPEIEGIILKSLEKDAKKRFQDCAQLAAALEKVLPAVAGGQSGGAATAVAASGGRSLMTVLEQSIAKQRGRSVMDEFPQVAPQAGVDQIQVMEKGKPVRSFPVSTPLISVGRIEDNQIILDDAKVSRHHVRIEQVSGRYMVTDQGSSNGTYLGGLRLFQGAPMEWTPEQPLQVGDTYLKLVRAPAFVNTQVVPAATAHTPAAPIPAAYPQSASQAYPEFTHASQPKRTRIPTWFLILLVPLCLLFVGAAAVFIVPPLIAAPAPTVAQLPTLTPEPGAPTKQPAGVQGFVVPTDTPDNQATAQAVQAAAAQTAQAADQTAAAQAALQADTFAAQTAAAGTAQAAAAYATQVAAEQAAQAATAQAAADQAAQAAAAQAAAQTATRAAQIAAETEQAAATYAAQTAAAREVSTPEISQKYAALGGAAGILGPAKGAEISLGGSKVYRKYQNGVIYYSPDTGAHEVHGLILQLWTNLGEEKSILGYPVTDESVAPDGIGRYNHFQGGSIYWTPKTGAHEVHGDIRKLWADLGWEKSILGYPVTDESAAPDGVGRYNHFQGGSIYWTPKTGAREVHGSIRELWSKLGWEKSILGYPVTNESATPDGIGRYNHFQGGSIYWTPSTGAHEVHGSIRELWSKLGWEKSLLGYPATDELTTPDGVGRFNHFQGGSIYWTPNTGAHEVHGPIRELWSSLGWETGWLGYPISDVEPSSGEWTLQCRFQHGTIKWSQDKGATAIANY